MKKEIYEETSNNNHIKSELTDVFVCVLEIANLYNIDLEAQFKQKIKDLTPRVKSWQNAKDLLKEKREKLD